jgi:hypothetical protein
MVKCSSCETMPAKKDGPLCWTCSRDKEKFEKAGLPWVPWNERGCDIEGYPLNPIHPWNNETRDAN